MMLSKEELRKIFNKHDPMGIFFEENIDEYDPEIKVILERKITKEETQENLTKDIWKIFQDYFGELEAGPREKYSPIAEEILKKI